MDAITNPLTTTGSSASASTSGRSPSSTLNPEEFYEVMIAELLNQDPLEPMDNQQFLNQLVQTQTLDATSRLADGIEALLLGQQISSAGALIGKDVAGLDANGGTISGVIDRVLVNGDDVQLGIGDQTISLKSVTRVSAPGPEEGAGA